jgi:acyl-CoA reductase-like NAD-dependent aldehyde dehydrogenase
MDDINFSSSSYHQDISNMLADRIEENNDDIFAVLRDYQLDNVTHYEIERTIRTLRNIAVLNEYLSKGKIGTASVFLPTNLPLYSLFVFALITAFQCERVIVRPNSIMQESNVISRLVDRLRISDLLPHVFVANIERTQFMDHIRSSDLVVFTGKPVNAMKIVDQMKPGATLLNNGSGHNPIVIAKKR